MTKDFLFQVRYLGAAPVGGRVASVRGLQEPLCDLLGRSEYAVEAELEVSRRGLTFRTSETSEKTNPFRRIAVWSALRLRSKKLPSGEIHYAFVPLVGDESVKLSNINNDKHADLYRTMRGLNRNDKSSPPIFAVVMRRPGAVRLLECHAFVCKIEEDAVAAAATLYRALLADLDSNRRRPRQTNGVGCVSLASAASSISVLDKNHLTSNNPPPPRPTAPHPVRPPRIKKNSLSGNREEVNSSSSGIDNGIVRDNKKIVEVKAEDILEGRSRRSSITNCNSSRSVSLEISKDKSVVKLFKDNQSNLIGDFNDDKLKVSVNSNGEDMSLKNDNKNDYEVFKKMSKRDIINGNNSGMRSRSASQIDSNKNRDWYDKMVKGNGKDNYIVYGNRENIIEGRRSSNGKISSEFYDKNIGKECYGFSKDENNFYGVSKESEDSEIKIRDREMKKKDIYDINRGSKSKRGEIDVYKIEDFKDIDKILPLNTENDYQKSGPKSTMSSVYVKRITEDIKIGDMIMGRKNSTGIIKPIGKTSSEISFDKKSIDYTDNKGYVRRTSRAGSEPPKIISTDDDPAFMKNHHHHENRLKKAQSDLDLDGGDLMTRVELPRRGSFLNSSCARKIEKFQGGTPLGFTELFDEFRNQEGLTSVDDILAAIIGKF